MINYFDNEVRSTPINLAVARLLLSGLMLWKIIQYRWGALPTWPTPIWEMLPVFRKPVLFTHINWIALICGLLLVCVFIGYRTKFTAFSSAVLLTYLGTVRHVYQMSHTSRILFNGALILVLFAVFADEDKLSVDQLRRTRNTQLQTLSTSLGTNSRRFQHRPLKWALVIIGFFYFQGGFSKIVFGNPVAWTNPANLSRVILFRIGDGFSWFIGEFLLQYPHLLMLTAILTLVLEAGFLPSILTGRQLWPFFVGLMGMHVAIAFSVGPLFTDQLIFLLLFISWDQGQKWLQRADDLIIVYDRHSFFCVRSLYLLTYFDTMDSIAFYNQCTIPDGFQRNDIEFEHAIYAFRGNSMYFGYDSFIQLFKQLGVLRIVAVVIELPGIRYIGDGLYKRMNEGRSWYFVGSILDN